MPSPPNERQALERERAELLTQMAACRRTLENAPPLSRAGRERLEWQIAAAERRMAEVERRLAGS